MKILHVNYYAGHGGAGIASYNLHQALRQNGVDSHFFAIESAVPAEANLHLATPPTVRKCHIIQHLENILLRCDNYKANLPRALNLFSSGATREIIALKPDIIHLHWCHGGMLSLAEFANFPVPVVVTLHDSWLISGAEHHPKPGDNRYIEGYSAGFDFWNRWTFQRKQNLWQNWRPQCIAPSQWLTERFRRSYWGKKRPINSIANLVDTATFFPGSHLEARQYWGIAPGVRVLVFGAMSLHDRNKGGQELRDALQILAQRGVKNLHLLLPGAVKSLPPLPYPATTPGLVTTPQAMAKIYQASDVTVLASKQDNLPNMLLEAAACGSATAGFPVGGIPEILTQCRQGFLSKDTTPTGLADVIEQALSTPRSTESNLASVYTPQAVISEHIRLYKSLI